MSVHELGLLKSSVAHTALFAGGCFWCTEAVFQRVRGIVNTCPGYVWMNVGSPTTEDGGRARVHRMEVVRVQWEPELVRLVDLLDIFYATSAPTVVSWELVHEFSNVRSGLFFDDPADLETAQKHLRDVSATGFCGAPILTKIMPMAHFEPASEFDRSFYLRNPGDGFCRSIIDPKLKKLLREFPGHCVSASVRSCS